MIEKEDAVAIHEHALVAIRELSTILKRMNGRCSEDEYSQIKKAVGLSIGKIQIDILELINAAHPDLDDLS